MVRDAEYVAHPQRAQPGRLPATPRRDGGAWGEGRRTPPAGPAAERGVDRRSTAAAWTCCAGPAHRPRAWRWSARNGPSRTVLDEEMAAHRACDGGPVPRRRARVTTSSACRSTAAPGSARTARWRRRADPYDAGACWSTDRKAVGASVRRVSRGGAGRADRSLRRTASRRTTSEERIAFTAEALRSLACGDPRRRGRARVHALEPAGQLRVVRRLRHHLFELIAVDRTTFVRNPKASLAWLGEAARRNGLLSDADPPRFRRPQDAEADPDKLAELRDPVPAGEECTLPKPGSVGISVGEVIVVLGDATCPQAISTGGGRVRSRPGWARNCSTSSWQATARDRARHEGLTELLPPSAYDLGDRPLTGR